MRNRQRCLLVVSGPSGVGKDTVVQALIRLHPEIELSVSATTRRPRAGEVDGVHYHFLTLEQFNKWEREGNLLEFTCYNGNCYGTPRMEVDRRIREGITCVLVIEVEGMANVKRLYPESTAVFIMPPSMEELERRLHKRGSEDEQAIAGRIARAREEMEYAPAYDFRLMNADPEECAVELYRILQERCAE